MAAMGARMIATLKATIEGTVKKIEDILDNLEERTTKLEALKKTAREDIHLIT